MWHLAGHLSCTQNSCQCAKNVSNANIQAQHLESAQRLHKIVFQKRTSNDMIRSHEKSIGYSPANACNVHVHGSRCVSTLKSRFYKKRMITDEGSPTQSFFLTRQHYLSEHVVRFGQSGWELASDNDEDHERMVSFTFYFKGEHENEITSVRLRRTKEIHGHYKLFRLDYQEESDANMHKQQSNVNRVHDVLPQLGGIAESHLIR